LFVGRVISGITAATFSTAGAYIADVTPPERRAGGFGLLGAAFGIGFVLGPAFGGVLGAVDPRLPFWIAAGLSLTNAMYGLFVLPESLPPERRAPFDWRRGNPIGSLGLLRSRPGLAALAGVNFFGYLAHESLPSTFVLYAGYRWGWDERAMGLFLAGVGICAMVVQGILVQRAVTHLGERAVLLGGLLLGALGFGIYASASNGAAAWAGVPLQALWGLASPTALGMMTRRVNETEQGRLQGANASMRGISGLIGPSLFTLTFAHFIGTEHLLPGAPFFLAAAMLVAALALGARATQRE
jgi:DHA1 family tetracycline resistance protein-like MFS transporter